MAAPCASARRAAAVPPLRASSAASSLAALFAALVVVVPTTLLLVFVLAAVGCGATPLAPPGAAVVVAARADAAFGGGAAAAGAARNGVPVYAMLPLDTISASGALQNAAFLEAAFEQLASGSVEGVMVDVWWGATERDERAYNFTGYAQLFALAQSYRLALQVVMSFHQCGGNVGDACDVALPAWVLAAGSGAFYTDASGNVDFEYVSLGADARPLFGAARRTAVQMYSDFMVAFAKTFADELRSGAISLVEVGMGPAGELRYPSYQLAHWSFCGIGAFQAFDPMMAADWRAHAAQLGHPEWNSPPTDAGSYDAQPPDSVPFFKDGGGYTGAFGQAFLSWYSGQLIAHGDAVLGAARAAFGPSVAIAAKVAGVHWWYKSASHAAEVTAGYYNTNGNNGYSDIAAMCARHGAWFLFTCLEMVDSSQPASCDCGPEELVAQTRDAATAAGVVYAGENALPRYDYSAYQQIVAQSDVGGQTIAAFTYLRLDPTLLAAGNWQSFVQFVSQMNALSSPPSSSETSSADVGVI